MRKQRLYKASVSLTLLINGYKEGAQLNQCYLFTADSSQAADAIIASYLSKTYNDCSFKNVNISCKPVEFPLYPIQVMK